MILISSLSYIEKMLIFYILIFKLSKAIPLIFQIISVFLFIVMHLNCIKTQKILILPPRLTYLDQHHFKKNNIKWKIFIRQE